MVVPITRRARLRRIPTENSALKLIPHRRHRRALVSPVIIKASLTITFRARATITGNLGANRYRR